MVINQNKNNFIPNKYDIKELKQTNKNYQPLRNEASNGFINT